MTALSAPAGASSMISDGRQSPAAAAIMRGTQRLMRSLGYSSITELPLVNGRRADIVSVAPDGGICIVEVKSCVADFRADRKWQDYLDYCDRFYFAVDSAMPEGIIPEDVGLIVADSYAAAIIRNASLNKANGSRRRATLLAFAKCAADRLHNLVDPEAGSLLRRG
jgi:hypothetical protein